MAVSGAVSTLRRLAPRIDRKRSFETAMEEDIISTFKGVVNTKCARMDKLSVSNTLASSYTSNTNKEELCLEYVENFYSQFKKLFPERPALFICPLNEAKIPKFVCTTVRPSLLPYRDLYDYGRCATFVSNIIEYEPLANPTALPQNSTRASAL